MTPQEISIVSKIVDDVTKTTMEGKVKDLEAFVRYEIRRFMADELNRELQRAVRRHVEGSLVINLQVTTTAESVDSRTKET